MAGEAAGGRTLLTVLWQFLRGPSYRFMEKKKAGNKTILTLRKYSWRGEDTVQYVGSGTVWYTYPDFVRAGTGMGLMLSDIMVKQKHLDWEQEHGQVSAD